MDEHARREILTAVAEGRMRPDEAAARLADHGPTRAGERPHDNGGHDDHPIRRVRVSGAFRHARIVGDPNVREAVAEGPHAARREGDTLVIEGDQQLPGFSFRSGPRPGRSGFPFFLGDFDPSWWARQEGFPPQLTVRMHPDLPVEIELTAGRATVDRLNGPLKATVTAGSAELRSVSGPLDIGVAAGMVRATGRLTEGASRVRCEAGSIRLNLEHGSSVRVRARAELGRLVLPRTERSEGWLAGSVNQEVTVGQGAGTLDVEVTMGDVEVTAA